jgi:pyruvate/2-oxoacid:ferredoxin oxidoreductase alpha subunit
MYVAQKNRLKCVVPCPRLDPLPMSITMLTALIYAVSNCQSKADEAALNKARDDGYKEGVSRVQTDHYEEYYKELKEKVDAYEKASGLLISYGWTQSEKIGKVVRMLMDGKANIKTVLEQARYGVGHAERIRETLQKQVEVLQAAFDGIPQKEDDDEQ